MVFLHNVVSENLAPFVLDSQHGIFEVLGTKEDHFPYFVQTPLGRNTFRAVDFSIHHLRMMLVNIMYFFQKYFFLAITALFRTEIIAPSNIPALCQYTDNNDVNTFTLLLLTV